MRSSVDIRTKLKQLNPQLLSIPKKREPVYRQNLDKWIEGKEVQNDYGRCFKSVTKYTELGEYGSILFNELDDIDSRGIALAAKDEKLLHFDYKKTLFIDTETTGLAGGTGTVPFLIGIGYFADNSFYIEQYMMRDYDEEIAMLHALRERFKKTKFIVSYNGKSYDLNILSTRLILARMKNFTNDINHFDLLYTVRRIWGARLQDCSLVNVERKILNFYRNHDIPGCMIPDIYFIYIKSGDGKRMIQVFKHNRLDILTLAVLAIQTAKIYLKPEKYLKHAQDFASIARSYENMNEIRNASLCYKKALQNELLRSDREQILYRLGYIFKRNRYWSKANKVWKYIIKNYADSMTAYEELAKYYEHKEKDFKKASNIVNQALQKVEIREDLKRELKHFKTRAEFEYRLRRLKRKVLQ